MVLRDRELKILRIVEQADGECDARQIDVIVSSRHGPGEISVRDQLLALAAVGLLTVEDGRGIGGVWSLTGKGRRSLAKG